MIKEDLKKYHQSVSKIILNKIVDIHFLSTSPQYKSQANPTNLDQDLLSKQTSEQCDCSAATGRGLTKLRFHLPLNPVGY
jgi:hypothetical protein